MNDFEVEIKFGQRKLSSACLFTRGSHCCCNFNALIAFIYQEKIGIKSDYLALNFDGIFWNHLQPSYERNLFDISCSFRG